MSKWISPLESNNRVYNVVSSMFLQPYEKSSISRLSVLGFSISRTDKGVILTSRGLSTYLNEVTENDNALYVGSDGRTYKALDEAVVGLFEPHLRDEVSRRL